MSYTHALATRSTSFPMRLIEAVRSFVLGPFNLKDPALVNYFGRGYESAAGISVTVENAFTFSAVFDAVNQISSDEAKLPLNLLKRRKDGGSDLYTTSKLYKLLKYEPNPEMSAMVFRRTLLAHALTCHGGYAEIERDGADRPIALWILTPDRVRPYRDNVYDSTLGRRRLGPLEYLIDGGPTTLPAKDVIHIHGLGYDGYCGYSVIDKARQTIALALAAEKFGANYFGKGTLFGGWLESDADLDEPQKKEIKDNIEAFRAQQDAAFRILVTGQGHKFHQFTNKPSESQMDESRLRQVEEVARFFRMPPYKLGVNTPGTVSYASVEAANLDYYTGCLLDWITLVEQEFNRKLISPLEQGQQFIKHNVNAFLRADTAARSAFYMAMLDRGVFNADMVLDLEDMNPQPNGQGQLLLVQGAMIPKDKLVEKIDADIAKTKQPPPPPTPAPTDDSVDEANARAAAATLMAEEARRLANEERERRIAAEATGQATAEELTHLRESERQALTQASQLTAMAETLRAEAQAAQTARETAEQARQAEATARSDAERQAGEAEARRLDEEVRARAAQAESAAERTRAEQAIADAESRRVAAEEARLVEADARAQAETLATERHAQAARAHELAAAAEARAQAAMDAAQAAQERADETAAALATLQRTHAADREALAAAEQAVIATRQLVDAREAERVRSETEAATAQRTAEDIARQVVEIEAELEALRADNARAVEARIQAEQDATAALLASDTAARQAHQDSEAREAERVRLVADQDAERLAAQTAQEALERRLAEAIAARTVAEEETRTVREADAAGLAAQIAAHRALVVDIVRRMIERETDRARRAQATPEKLRRWLETFYEDHEALMQRALLPAITIHLSFIRSSEPPIDATRRVVQTHVRESQRQVRMVLDGDADEIAASLPALLYRWEQERTTPLADALMEKELTYARRI